MSPARGSLVLAAVLLLACERGEASTPVPTPTLAEVDERAREEPTPLEPDATAEMTGVLVPEAEVVLVSSGFARLARLDLELGEHVAADEVVAELDVRGDRSELDAARAAWRASRAELERLELELEQARASRADVEQLENYVSRAELREQRFAEQLAAARKRSAGASLARQRSEVAEAEARLADSRLRAPFDGRVARLHADPGATLSLGDPVVELISDARVLRFAVPEALAGQLVLGAPVRVRFADPELELAGEVSSIAPEIEAGARLIFAEARVELGVTEAELRVGAIARVRFAAEE